MSWWRRWRSRNRRRTVFGPGARLPRYFWYDEMCVGTHDE